MRHSPWNYMTTIGWLTTDQRSTSRSSPLGTNELNIMVVLFIVKGRDWIERANCSACAVFQDDWPDRLSLIAMEDKQQRHIHLVRILTSFWHILSLRFILLISFPSIQSTDVSTRMNYSLVGVSWLIVAIHWSASLLCETMCLGVNKEEEEDQTRIIQKDKYDFLTRLFVFGWYCSAWSAGVMCSIALRSRRRLEIVSCSIFECLTRIKGRRRKW